MIIHRDYCDTGDSCVKIFPDRIDFFNPGALPLNLSVDAILSGNYVSAIRNKLIASIFNEAGLIEKYWSVLTRILKAFRARNSKLPLLENIQNGFRITTYPIAGTVEKILTVLQRHPYITLKDLAGETGLSRRGVEYNIKMLKDKKQIRRVGPDKGGYWDVME
jgi:ATP-dependent DNA helicase RecG